MNLTKEQFLHKLHAFIINTKYFAKAPDNILINNTKLQELEAHASELEQLYEKLIEHSANVQDFTQLIDNLQKIHELYKNIHPKDKLILHEKSDLQTEASFLLRDFYDLYYESKP